MKQTESGAAANVLLLLSVATAATIAVSSRLQSTSGVAGEGLLIIAMAIVGASERLTRRLFDEPRALAVVGLVVAAIEHSLVQSRDPTSAFVALMASMLVAIALCAIAIQIERATALSRSADRPTWREIRLFVWGGLPIVCALAGDIGLVVVALGGGGEPASVAQVITAAAGIQMPLLILPSLLLAPGRIRLGALAALVLSAVLVPSVVLSAAVGDSPWLVIGIALTAVGASAAGLAPRGASTERTTAPPNIGDALLLAIPVVVIFTGTSILVFGVLILNS